MKVVLEGNFLSTRKGTSQNGKDYVFTSIVVGDEAKRIYGYDPGSNVKRFDPVKVNCDIRDGDKGMFISYAKD